MARNASFEDFYKKVSETLIEDNITRGYHCYCDLFFHSKEALTSSNSKIWIKFSS